MPRQRTKLFQVPPKLSFIDPCLTVRHFGAFIDKQRACVEIDPAKSAPVAAGKLMHRIAAPPAAR
jgi:hypothetical protein